MKTTKTGPLLKIEHTQNSTPSWRVAPAEGLASIELTSHDSRRYLDITVTETAFASTFRDQKRDVTRAASITLDEPAAAALFNALKAHFEPVDA